MNKMIVTVGAAAVLLSACGGSPVPSKVEVTDLWCRAAPASAPAAGCYVTLTASAKDRFVAVESPAAGQGQIHTMSVDGGIMRMRELKDGVALPKGVPVALKPGGLHIMLIGPKAPMVAGGTVPMTLRFENAPAVTLNAPIRARSAAPAGDKAPAKSDQHSEHDH